MSFGPRVSSGATFLYPECLEKEDNHTGREAGDPAKRSLNSVTRNV